MTTKSASKNQLKMWRKLLMGKYRKKEQKFLAEGTRCVEQIIQNGRVQIHEILITEQNRAEINDFPGSIPIYILSNDDFAAVSDTETSQGVIAVCSIPDEAKLSALANNSVGIIAAFDAIQDPGNMGTMIRTASWFGVRALLFGTGCVDPFHPKVVRSTAGATGILPYIKGDLEPVFSELESHRWNISLLDGAETAVNLHTHSFNHKSVLVVGNEGRGIDSGLFNSRRNKIRIDGKRGSVESLNAAVAFSIALHTAQLKI